MRNQTPNLSVSFQTTLHYAWNLHITFGQCDMDMRVQMNSSAQYYAGVSMYDLICLVSKT